MSQKSDFKLTAIGEVFEATFLMLPVQFLELSTAPITLAYLEVKKIFI